MSTERRARSSDIPRLMEIRSAVPENRLSDPQSVTRADYDRFVETGRVWVSEVEDTVVGFSASDATDGSIWALFMDPAYLGRGIGTALLRRACQDLHAEGHSKACLTTEPGTKADRLYRTLGWADVGRSASGEVCFELSL